MRHAVMLLTSFGFEFSIFKSSVFKMAKVFGAIIGLCVFISLITIETECKIVEDTDLLHKSKLNSIRRIKRDTTYNEPDKVESKNLTSIPLLSTQPKQIARTNSRQLDSSNFNDSLSAITGTYRDKPLLGVNGTGQKLDISATKPPIVSEPINPSSPFNQTSKLLSALMPTSKPIDGLSDLDDNPYGNIDNVDKLESETNKTLLQNNLTKFVEDYHIYYNSTIVVDVDAVEKYFNSFNNLTTSHLLSKSYRRAMTVNLSFDFPFYGHLIRNVTVATGGFLYTGEYVHSWLAATQYIAPLMANFDTSISNDSFVKYMDNGTSFIVVWENVTLQERPNVGTFTFSATLHKTGDVVFAYYAVPIIIEAIQDDKHPVKVGLSDAYIIDKTIYFARRKTIYEYHRVNFGNEDIRNGTMIFLIAQPTCLMAKDCDSCLSNFATLKCNWCPTINRCSTGMDRQRQDWLQKSCDKTLIVQKLTCPPLGGKGNNAAQTTTESDASNVSHRNDLWIHTDHNNTVADESEEEFTYKAPRMGSPLLNDNEQITRSSDYGMVFGVLIPIAFVVLAVVWVFYAYRNPHTKSGQFLIQYRPSQWTWRRGEARYTAATIHM